jgi:outer membrane protein OmpA-like peptidoglycan-associated protein
MKGPQKYLLVLLGGIALVCARAAVSAPLSARTNYATVDDMVVLPSNVAFAPDIPAPEQPDEARAEGPGDSEFTSETVAELGRMNEDLVKQLSAIKDQMDAMDGGQGPVAKAKPKAKTVARAGPEPVAPLNTEEEIVFEAPAPSAVQTAAAPAASEAPAQPAAQAMVQASANDEPKAGDASAPDLAVAQNPAESKEIAAGGDSPFGVSVTSIPHKRLQASVFNRIEFEDAAGRRADKMFAQAKPKVNPFVKTFSAIRPQKPAPASAAPAPSRPAARPARNIRRNMSSADLKRELRSAYISENRYLSAAEDGEDDEEWDDEEYEEEEEEDYEDAPADPAPAAAPAAMIPPAPRPESGNRELASAGGVAGAIGAVESFDGKRAAKAKADLPPGPLKVGNRNVLQMKLEFNPDDDAISAESVNIIRSFAQIVTDSPTKTIEIGISERVVSDDKLKKLTARRIAIVSNVLRHAGVSDRQIRPLLTSRDSDSFSFRAVDNDVFERISVTKGEADAFGEGATTTSYELMRW